jgi:S-adenosylmethionine hydrolase
MPAPFKSLCADFGILTKWVAEVNTAAHGVRQMSIIKDLKHEVEYILMSLFNIIHQDHAVNFLLTASVNCPPSS